jgi:hypothetical protein
MTDKELLELAAKAARFEIDVRASFMTWRENNLIALVNSSGEHSLWNPLTDDGDALRLAVKLRLELVSLKDTIVSSRAVAWKDGTAQCCLWEPENDDSYAATRRAIVRAAAEIGKSL